MKYDYQIVFGITQIQTMNVLIIRTALQEPFQDRVTLKPQTFILLAISLPDTFLWYRLHFLKERNVPEICSYFLHEYQLT